ncbi:LOW QUALITY PROTEIN: Neuron-specific vesicular protein calcyon [Galemys pyrenaicus]|uniref:Neuron-specific vesicular protein calcyon n=1 Tax=Galemys pyrenaicus TaxID=202257 RepID=A0A8J6AVY6_GALPY|nr:LOW QUALITY PROTEIN: Neuron-specific vesicular protein calcyon [Galemys pyrenaicus]
MVKLGCSFLGKPGKDPGGQDGVAMDSVPLISPLDVSQLQPPFANQAFSISPGDRARPGLPSVAASRVQESSNRGAHHWPASTPHSRAPSVAIKMQTEYQLCSAGPAKTLSDLEAQKLSCGHQEEAGKQMPTARMVAFAMALLGCVLVMYKAIWYDQFTCPNGFLLRQHKICTPLTLEMYYTEMGPEHHRSVLAAIGAYPLSRKHGTQVPAAWADGARAAKERPKTPPTPADAAAAATKSPAKPAAEEDPEASRSPLPPTPQ